MEKLTAEEALSLLNLGKLPLPATEITIFNKEYEKFCVSSGEIYDPIEIVLQFYSKILPELVHPNEETDNYYRFMARDNNFQKNIIDSGIAEKIRKGIPLKNLIGKVTY
jgi:hypothetical protein